MKEQLEAPSVRWERTSRTLRKTAKELMREFSEEKGEKKKKIRLVGVRVSNLLGVNEKQRRIVAFSASDMFF